MEWTWFSADIDPPKKHPSKEKRKTDTHYWHIAFLLQFKIFPDFAPKILNPIFSPSTTSQIETPANRTNKTSNQKKKENNVAYLPLMFGIIIHQKFLLVSLFFFFFFSFHITTSPLFCQNNKKHRTHMQKHININSPRFDPNQVKHPI